MDSNQGRNEYEAKNRTSISKRQAQGREAGWHEAAWRTEQVRAMSKLRWLWSVGFCHAAFVTICASMTVDSYAQVVILTVCGVVLVTMFWDVRERLRLAEATATAYRKCSINHQAELFAERQYSVQLQEHCLDLSNQITELIRPKDAP